MNERTLTESATDLLRHAVATLAYRAEKVLRDPPANFATFRVGPTTRTPLELVAHLADLAEWATRLVEGAPSWAAVPHSDWQSAVDRFATALQSLDAAIARAPTAPANRLLQGPIADALTHVGQLAMLRGLAGSPIRPESYARAEIVAGRVALAPGTPRFEFDGDASPPARA